MRKSIQSNLRRIVVGTALVAAATTWMPRPAQADTASTAAIIAGAAAIVGALLIDSNNQPYYVNDNERYYVSQNEATYYRNHHNVVQRQAWVPEDSYPVRRNGGYQIQPQQTGQYRGNQTGWNQGRGNQGRGNQGRGNGGP